ncbi:unnamed protein product [Rodentolepis nana]|uniref:Band 7 protein n=1 Tax=Rodentolepis nana TaxID=102285 RepID=A0A0R3TXN1_RODNA|nr:unnamed protein product [Rodentolepis nana]
MNNIISISIHRDLWWLLLLGVGAVVLWGAARLEFTFSGVVVQWGWCVGKLVVAAGSPSGMLFVLPSTPVEVVDFQGISSRASWVLAGENSLITSLLEP